ncbi:MAG: DUF4062 domain-containing protein [Verrucomicrobia bacterium]|nr:DUF4062 domain-containing protein [Verrucomicrobiota bacterium]
MKSKPGQLTTMISSTSLDLPSHRREVLEACLRQGIFPIGMEHLPARDADAIRVSMEMVDKADIYIGIFAWRYGHRPEGHKFRSPSWNSIAPWSGRFRFSLL